MTKYLKNFRAIWAVLMVDILTAVVVATVALLLMGGCVRPMTVSVLTGEVLRNE